MAVVITTKFYNGSEFRNLAKIVFTSPNMDSPNSAGTRSHILPGVLNLGMWYEDTTNMYIIETAQNEYNSTYFGYSADLCGDVDLDDPPVSVGVYNTNQTDWLEFIRDAVGGVVGYAQITVSGSAEVTATAGITNPENAFNGGQWTVSAQAEDHSVLLYFSTSIRPVKITFSLVADYEAKYFDIKATYDPTNSGITCTTPDVTWTTLYDGTSQDNMLEYSNNPQTFSFSNVKPFSHIKFNFYSKWSTSNGYSMSDCTVSGYNNDDTITTQKAVHVGIEGTPSSNQILYVANAQPGTSDDVDVILDLDGTQGTETAVSGTTAAAWGWPGSWPTRTAEPDVNSTDSIVFELTTGATYSCRLTAWDDATHSTTLNTLIATDRCRVSCVAYNANGTSTLPTENEGISFIHPPVLNNIFKGNVVYEGQKFYYGDFNMIYRTGSVLGDYLIFKPMLYNIDDTVPYGIHDHVITLHYSYT